MEEYEIFNVLSPCLHFTKYALKYENNPCCKDIKQENEANKR